MKKDEYKAIIKAYENGQSMTSIAKDFNTYATSIKRILERYDVKLRHDSKRTKDIYDVNAQKLLEWVKTQDRLVTRAELAEVIGRDRLSPIYFEKYPELRKYVIKRGQNNLHMYSQKLYDWLQEKEIKYKANDRTKLKMNITALLLEEYEGLALQINIKPSSISKKKYKEDTDLRIRKAKESDLFIIWLNEKHFENLDSILTLLNIFKKDEGDGNNVSPHV